MPIGFPHVPTDFHDLAGLVLQSCIPGIYPAKRVNIHEILLLEQLHSAGALGAASGAAANAVSAQIAFKISGSTWRQGFG